MQQSIEPLILLTKKSSRRWSRYVCILVRLLSFSLFFFFYFQYQMRYGAKNILTCSFKHFWWKSKSNGAGIMDHLTSFFFQYRSNLQVILLKEFKTPSRLFDNFTVFIIFCWLTKKRSRLFYAMQWAAEIEPFMLVSVVH